MAVAIKNIDIKVTIYRLKNGSTTEYNSYELWPRTDEQNKNGYISLVEIILNEDMFAPSVTGSLVFMDSSNLLDQFNLSTNEWLRLEFDGKPPCDFRISDVKIESNLAQKTTHGPSGSPVKVIFNFASDEFLYRNFDVVIDDFIGKISKDPKNGSNLTSILPAYSDKIKIPDKLKDEEKGFVQYLMEQASAQKSKKPLQYHETFNDIWVKHLFNFYPFYKDANNLRISQLMNYICEYACYKKNEKAVNFFFWEDLDSWNFKCIEGLIEDQLDNIKKFKLPVKETEFSTLPVFKPHLDEFSEKAMFSMEVLNDYDSNYFLDSGLAFSTYDRVKPNWGNPYREYVDINEGYITKTINYNYTLDLNNWYDISGKKNKDEKVSIFPKSIDFLRDKTGLPRFIKDETTGEFRVDPASLGDPTKTPHGYTGDKLLAFNNYSSNAINDTIFGYYSNPYNLAQISSWQLASFNHTTEKHYWQSQFDFCELPGAVLLLVDRIKKATKKASKVYSDLKIKKATWDVYKKKMCCERSVPSSFFAVLVGAEKIHGSTGGGSYPTQDPGGIWAYSWIEVELWPQEKTKQKKLDLKTTTYDQDEEGNTVTDVTTETETIDPKNNITEMLKAGYQIIEFDPGTEEDKKTDFPFVFVSPPWALKGFTSDTYKKNVIVNGGGDGPSGNKIKEVEITTKDNRAFNLNELLNSRIPVEYETSIPTNNNNTTILMNPGISTILTDSLPNSKSAYPVKTQMLPVGKFRIVSDNCPNFLNNGQKKTDTQNGFYYAGRIVQMSAVPKETLQTIILNGVNDATVRGFAGTAPEIITEDIFGENEDGTQGGFIGTQEKINPDYKNPVDRDYMFLFDTENAHDGFCGECS
jgi:hypothetical protein